MKNFKKWFILWFILILCSLLSSCANLRCRPVVNLKTGYIGISCKKDW